MASVDCNDNLIPDECDLAAGTSDDCNLDGQPDECAICPIVEVVFIMDTSSSMTDEGAALCGKITEVTTALEANLIARQENVERTALKLYEAGETDLARNYLNYYCSTEAMNGLQLGEALADSIEARTKVIDGIRQPK